MSQDPDHAGTDNANQLQDAELSTTERLCRSIADWTGAPIALITAIVAQLVWIAIGIYTQFDPFPFVFLLTVSNVLQLILIFVIAVAQRQQSRHDQLRAVLDHQALRQLLAQQEVHGTLLSQLAARQGVDVTKLPAMPSTVR